MSNSPTDDHPAEDANAQRGPGTGTGTPRWAKIFAAVAGVLIVLLVVVLLVSGGRHGPGRHLPSGEGSGAQPPKIEQQRRRPPQEVDGHRPPPGAH